MTEAELNIIFLLNDIRILLFIILTLYIYNLVKKFILSILFSNKKWDV